MERARREADELLRMAEQQERGALVYQRALDARKRWLEQAEALKRREKQAAVDRAERAREVEQRWRERERLLRQ